VSHKLEECSGDLQRKVDQLMLVEGDALVLADHGRRWLRFSSPIAVLSATCPNDVVRVLADVEREVRTRQCYAVGMVAYEAGAAYGLAAHAPVGDLPLAWFALYPASSAQAVTRPLAAAEWRLEGLTASWSREAHAQAFTRVKQHILDGDCYQVNTTFALQAQFAGNAATAFAQLAGTQRGRYAAALRLPEHSICSASPELFFSRHGSTIVARPMKGSAPRGRWAADDRAAAMRLRASPKDRAENVMVVDMVRNDLGRIARTGSVRVRRLFVVERYPTIWQMTSEVAADTDAGLADIFAALFPSASITGAPKVRVMEVIKAIEPGPRGIYTGAIGYLAPDGSAQFSVAIRTLLIDHRRGELSFGVGSGVVWDSDGGSEYDECLLKGRVLAPGPPPFDLLETLAWSPEDGFALLDAHLDRLQRSAAYFGVPSRRADARAALEHAVAAADTALVARLLVNRDGQARVETRPVPSAIDRVRVCVAREPIDQTDIFYFHKTTRRHEYDHRRCASCDDVILWNRKGEVTETTIANLVAEIDGTLVTPPVEAGLLAGTFRNQLLTAGRIVERHVRIDDLSRATGVWLVNSVRGWRRAEIVTHGRPGEIQQGLSTIMPPSR
jgi:para-aminobenzoate synthetase/4-amino-4-deoxychorismate lyase